MRFLAPENIKQFFAQWLFLCLFSIPISAESFKKSIEADLDFDGRKERIEINGERDKTLKISRGKKILWQGVPSAWKPWKLEIADVDNDGTFEIAVGVFKATKFFPEPHNCLFIYGFNDDEAFPKWLGSSLGRTFTDFIFADLSGEKSTRLFALETTREGKNSLGIYGWNGFGFTKNSRRGDWSAAKIIKVENGLIFIEADGETVSFELKDLR